MESLLDGFASALRQYPQRIALDLGDRRFTYEALAAEAARICGALSHAPRSRGDLVGLLAGESATAYQGVLAILANRRGFVPLDPHHPPAWLFERIRHAGLDTLVVGDEGLDRLSAILDQVGRPLTIIAPESEGLDGLAARHERHRFVDRQQVASHRQALPVPRLDEAGPACLLYTSGTTGHPRGVVVSQANLAAYLANAHRQIELRPDDRCSHTFPLTFDLSLHDLMTTWSAGATLVPWPVARRADPARFINEQRLTRWFSIPSVAMTMERLGELRPGRFSTLRHSLFCGEPLPRSVARAWSQAAPQSKVINLYGPTEATVAVTAFPVDETTVVGSQNRSIVPLGRPFDDQRALVVDDQGRQIHEAGRGELWLSGPQVVKGYHQPAPRADDGPFVERDGRTWFKTGDHVEIDPFGCLHFLGRLDERIKVRGHHVDLTEIDAALRQACGHPLAAAVPYPTDTNTVGGLVGLVESDEPDQVDTASILAGCRRHLPPALVPDRIVVVAKLPRNGRDKLDRNAMQQLLQSRED